MNVRESIEIKLREALAPQHLEVLDESHGHKSGAGAQTHFRVIVVSDAFEGTSRVARHRQINALLSDELAGPVHALAIEAVTPSRWAANGGAKLDAPPCRGGGA